MRRNNCMFAIPHELSGIGEVCGLLHNASNGLGKHCVAYEPHTAETRKQLADAIAAKRKAKKEGASDGK